MLDPASASTETEQMKNVFTKKRLIISAVCLLLVIASAVLLIAGSLIPGSLYSQQAAERWKADNPLDFTQVSCFMPSTSALSVSGVNEFRTAMMTKLHEAALDIDNDSVLFSDAWSTNGKVDIACERSKTSAGVTAVGGSFFAFHPLKLMSGGYLSENDFMKDRVILDKELAWYLFGGYDLVGMEVYINGVPFSISGVIDREDDFASKKAYSGGMGLYMSYEGYAALIENEPGIECYELVLAESVDGFAQRVVEDKFPIGDGEIVINSGRFSYWNLLRAFLHSGTRSMRTTEAAYPYWENAARYAEQVCMWLVAAGTALLIFPCVMLAIVIIKLLILGFGKLKAGLFPKAKDAVEEAVRKSKRKAWEKKQYKSRI